MKTKANLLQKEDDFHVTRAKKILEKTNGKQESSQEKIADTFKELIDEKSLETICEEPMSDEASSSQINDKVEYTHPKESMCLMLFMHNEENSSQTNDELKKVNEVEYTHSQEMTQSIQGKNCPLGKEVCSNSQNNISIEEEDNRNCLARLIENEESIINIVDQSFFHEDLYTKEIDHNEWMLDQVSGNNKESVGDEYDRSLLDYVTLLLEGSFEEYFENKEVIVQMDEVLQQTDNFAIADEVITQILQKNNWGKVSAKEE